MEFKRWCLGFVFSSDLEHVILLRKGRSLHIGLWNGVGGAIEKNESAREAMVRECREESNLSLEDSRWSKIGYLMSRSWQVDVFAAKLLPDEEAPYLSQFWTRTRNLPTDKAILVYMGEIHVLSMAPHTGALIHASLQGLRDPGCELINLSVG